MCSDIRRQVVVTGAAGGMGQAVCLLLAHRGYAVIGIDCDVGRLAMLRQLDVNIKTLAVDLADIGLVVQLNEVLGVDAPVAGLVNMVGISKGDSIVGLSDADWDVSFAVNVTPAMRLIRLLAPRMQAQKQGSIVNVGSPVGVIGARKPSYAASKAALHGLTMSCARNLGGDNVRVNLLLPGPTVTFMTADWDEERRTAIANGSFLKRLCTPDEVAKVVGFLIGDESSYITGSVIDMTAGSMYGH